MVIFQKYVLNQGNYGSKYGILCDLKVFVQFKIREKKTHEGVLLLVKLQASAYKWSSFQAVYEGQHFWQISFRNLSSLYSEICYGDGISGTCESF